MARTRVSWSAGDERRARLEATVTVATLIDARVLTAAERGALDLDSLLATRAEPPSGSRPGTPP